MDLNYNETTNLDESIDKTMDDEITSSNKPNEGWHKVAIGTATGIVLGTVATSFADSHARSVGMTNEEQTADSATDSATDAETSANPLVDSNISMASGVNDGMSFSQAFASARAEVGSGGVFEWHGKLYNTYTVDEWDHMSSAERADYNTHFAWSAHSSQNHNPATTEMAHHQDNHNSNGNVADVSNGDETSDYEPEVKVLGVVHDNAMGANIGGLLIDDQEVAVIDVDNDKTFDYAVSDLNHNGRLDEGEVLDISDSGLTVDKLGGYTEPGSFYADNENNPMDEPIDDSIDNNLLSI